MINKMHGGMCVQYGLCFVNPSLVLELEMSYGNHQCRKLTVIFLVRSHTPEITYNSLSQHIVVSVTKIAVINSTRDSLHMILSSIYSMIRLKSSIFDLQSYKSSYIGRKSSILRHNSKHPQSLINQYLCQNLFFNDKTSNLQTSWKHAGSPIPAI